MTIVGIISNIINCIGSVTNMIGISLKNKRKTLLCFTFGNLCVAIALGLLNAHVGMFVQLIFVIETIINYFWEKKYENYPIWIVLLYIFLPCLVLSITFKTAWDFLPIIASILFPLALLSKKLKLRLLNLFAVIVWVPYNLHFGQYAGAVSCSILAIINIIAIIRLDLQKFVNE